MSSNNVLVQPGQETEDDGRMSTLEVMKYLDDRQRERYSAFQETFESAGWPLVQEWAQVKQVEAEKRMARAQTSDEWRTLQGVLKAWQDVEDLANMFMSEFEAAAEQNKIDAEISSEDDDFGIEGPTE